MRTTFQPGTPLTNSHIPKPTRVKAGRREAKRVPAKFEKVPRLRRAEYLKALAEANLSCILGRVGYVCRGEVELAHVSDGTKGLSSKPPDFFVVPLCASHHRLHNMALDKAGVRGFDHFWQVNIWREVAQLMARFLTRETG